MSKEGQRKHAQFMDYIRGTEIGVTIPGVGLLTFQLIGQFVKASATLAGAAAPFVFELIHLGDFADHTNQTNQTTCQCPCS